MKPLSRGIAVAVLQCLIILSVAGKYAVDRNRLPRAWAKSAPYHPSLPLRGRYVSMRLEVDTPPAIPDANQGARLSIRDGRLFATPDSSPLRSGSSYVMIGRIAGRPWTLTEPVLFFLPEHAADPSRRSSGEELWVEVSIPRQGPPRPVRLGVKKNGILTPLAVQ